MPSKNSLKTYAEGGYYHIYNRGVNKRTIFKDDQDYAVFLSYLKTYLLPKDIKSLTFILANSQSSSKEKNQALTLLQLNNFHGRVLLIAYCLMPNHFHLLIHQTGEKDMESMMKSLMTRYTMCFNRRYRRIGPLFQGRYKAVLVDTDEQLLYLTRYIHRNPLGLKSSGLFQQPSSYKVYLGNTKQEWVKPEFILQNFSSSGFNSYRSFVESEDTDIEVQTAMMIRDISLDSN